MTIQISEYPMTDGTVRRMLFWLLQRLSSYTLWQRKRDSWEFFAKKYEEALKNWPEDITNGFDPESIIWIYDALRLYDEGLSELSMGNRQVWQTKTGEFDQMDRSADLVRAFFYLPCHDRGGQVEAYPPEIEKLNKLRLAAEFRGDHLIYPSGNNACNFYDADYILNPQYYKRNFKKLSYPVFPKTCLLYLKAVIF